MKKNWMLLFFVLTPIACSGNSVKTKEQIQLLFKDYDSLVEEYNYQLSNKSIVYEFFLFNYGENGVGSFSSAVIYGDKTCENCESNHHHLIKITSIDVAVKENGDSREIKATFYPYSYSSDYKLVDYRWHYSHSYAHLYGVFDNGCVLEVSRFCFDSKVERSDYYLTFLDSIRENLLTHYPLSSGGNNL